MQKNSSIWSSGTTSITLNVQSATKNMKKNGKPNKPRDDKQRNLLFQNSATFLCEINSNVLLSKLTYILFVKKHS